MSGLTVRKPTWTEVNDVQQHDVTHLQMTLDAIWDPNDPDCTRQETALRAAVLDPYTVPSRNVHSTQVRGQFARARSAVAFDVTDKTSDYIPRQLSNCTTDRDLERITTAIDGWNLDTDAFDSADKLMKPRPQSRATQSMQSIKDQAVNMPLDVDCCAKSLLH